MTDPELLERLFALILRLRSETDGFLDRPDEPQAWYDRGYADGMVDAIRALGHGAALPPDLVREPDAATAALAAEQALTPWGRAYAHGLEMGRKETHDVLEAA
jgi:hypothetical protein